MQSLWLNWYCLNGENRRGIQLKDSSPSNFPSSHVKFNIIKYTLQ